MDWFEPTESVQSVRMRNNLTRLVALRLLMDAPSDPTPRYVVRIRFVSLPGTALGGNSSEPRPSGSVPGFGWAALPHGQGSEAELFFDKPQGRDSRQEA